MTSKAYKSLLIESAVADIKKIEVFKSPADAIINSTRKGNVAEEVSKTRDATDAISVLGRIYDAHDNDRPLIENDEEHEAQGDSEISVELPDSVKNSKIEDIADVIPEDAGTVPNPDQQDQFKKALPDEAADLGLDESFVLEDDEEGDGNLPEDEIEDDEDDAGEDVCPECGKSECECDNCSDDDVVEDDDTLPEDEVTPVEGDDGEVVATELPEDEEVVDDNAEVEDESCQEDDDTLPEDEDEVDDTEDSVEGETLPEDEVEPTEGDDQGVEDTPVEDDTLPEDDDEEVTEDVDDSTLDEVEQTCSDEILAGGEGDQVPAEPIEKDGEVYEGTEDGAVEDPAIDPNANDVANVDAAQTVDDGTGVASDEGDTAAAQNAGDSNDQATEGEDPNASDPVLDIDSQVVASDTTQESVLESLMRSFRETSDEGYMSYESDDSEGDAD